ncbi:MAG: hypothetical protein AB8B69_02435 [Chitinophagales bacterium]
MLLNLTNHPSPRWQALQYQTAIREYQTIIDLPFPNIPPNYKGEDITELARSYLYKIQLLQQKHPKLTVHLMGELSFTFSLLQMLLKEGIDCVASTSERLTKEQADGTKTIKFEFVRFRKYQLLQ